jgi:AcrR family transcriptional regulator
MPTKTFMNLPDDKKNKIIQASIKEFSNATYEKASINKIIKDANISRGSFYMYFEDKMDLTMYLLEITKNHIIQQSRDVNQAVSGNLVGFIMGIHDVLFNHYQKPEHRNFFKNIIIYFQGRQESELRCIKGKMPINDDIHDILNLVDKTQFKDQSEEFIVRTIEISLVILRNVLFKSFMLDLDQEESKNLLKNYLEILHQGYGGKNYA